MKTVQYLFQDELAATLLGNEQASELLKEILGEKKAADQSLTELALTSSNQEAMGGTGLVDPEDSVEMDRPAGSRRGVRPFKPQQDGIAALMR